MAQITHYSGFTASTTRLPGLQSSCWEEGAQVHFPAPQDVDPAFWQPDLETISAYQQADIVLLNGANYARWLPRVSLAENRLLDTSRAFRDQFIPMNSGPVHSHGPEGQHSHGEFAFTLWLDLSLYLQQVDAIAAALQERLAQEPEVIARRQQGIVERITALDAELGKSGQNLQWRADFILPPCVPVLQSTL